MYAVKNYPFELRLVPRQLRNDEMCVQAILKNQYNIDYVPIKNMTPYFGNKVIFKVPQLLKYMPPYLINKAIAVNALHSNHNLIKYISKDMIDEDITYIYEKKCREFERQLNYILTNF